MQLEKAFQAGSPVLTPEMTELVTSIDPLMLDGVFAALPAMNERGDVNALVVALREHIPAPRFIERISLAESIAALRDLGMLAASLKRNGVEPIPAVPRLEEAFLMLSGKTDMVPRETCLHLGPWNPEGPRQRLFTGDASEAALYRATRIGARGVEAALHQLVRVLDTPLSTPDFGERCRTAAQHLQPMIDAVDMARSGVDPVFFARELRRYFEEIQIGGKKFSGAAAGTLSLGLMDHLLWASDQGDAHFHHFQSHTVRYAMPYWRGLYDDRMGKPSLTTRIFEELKGAPSEQELSNCRDLHEIFRQLLVFRGRHHGMAAVAYRVDHRIYDVGSGGFGLDTLKHILSLTLENSRMFSKYRN